MRAALGVRCSLDSLNTLLCALPRKFGWRRTRSGDVISTQEDAHEFALKLFHSCSLLDDAMCVHVSARVVCDTCGQSGEPQFFDENCLSVEVRARRILEAKCITTGAVRTLQGISAPIRCSSTPHGTPRRRREQTTVSSCLSVRQRPMQQQPLFFPALFFSNAPHSIATGTINL